jgi:hypothetical protein
VILITSAESMTVEPFAPTSASQVCRVGVAVLPVIGFFCAVFQPGDDGVLSLSGTSYFLVKNAGLEAL